MHMVKQTVMQQLERRSPGQIWASSEVQGAHLCNIFVAAQAVNAVGAVGKLAATVFHKNHVAWG